MFVRNYWYVAGWSSELGDSPLSRRILDEPIVLFRNKDGVAGALEDRCPHRFVPLSLGKMVDGTLQCAYHGLRFDLEGQCVGVPGQSHIPPGLCVRSYPIAERWNWVWIWMGDPEKADAGLIPDFHWLTDPAWTACTGTFQIKCAHDLLVENLHNHTHLQFVHARTIGTDGIADVQQRARRVGDEVHTVRWLLDRPAPALFAKAGRFEGNVDRWFNSIFVPPSNVILDIGCAPVGTGAPAGDRSKGIEIRSLHAITPATPNTTHYFWAYVRNFAPDSEDTTRLLAAGAKATFEEDVAILEAQERSMAEAQGRAAIDINCDSAALLVNKVRAELFERSHGATASALQAESVRGQ